MSFERNPYPDEEDNITGTVGSVSLTKLDGTTIPVENLPNEIEVRPTHPLDINHIFFYRCTIYNKRELLVIPVLKQ